MENRPFGSILHNGCAAFVAYVSSKDEFAWFEIPGQSDAVYPRRGGPAGKIHAAVTPSENNTWLAILDVRVDGSKSRTVACRSAHNAIEAVEWLRGSLVP